MIVGSYPMTSAIQKKERKKAEKIMAVEYNI